jgi:uncharacterized protein with GYD domain
MSCPSICFRRHIPLTVSRDWKRTRLRGGKQSNAVEALGGRLEAFYLVFGEHDWVLLADLPDNASATAFTLTVSKSGLVRTTTTPLLSVEEADRALEKKISFQAPSQFTGA